ILQPNRRHQPLNWRARGVEFRLSFPPWAAFEAPVQGRIGRPWPLNPEPGPFHFRIRGCLTEELTAERRLVNVRFGAQYGLKSDIAPSRSSAMMYGPAVRCKTEFQDRRT